MKFLVGDRCNVTLGGDRSILLSYRDVSQTLTSVRYCLIIHQTENKIKSILVIRHISHKACTTLMKKEKVILMRDYLKGLLFITCSLILIPALPLLVNRTSAEPKALPATVQIENIDTEYEYIDEVVVCDTVKQETFTLPTEDYLIAALRSQLAESTPKEAIKAQAMVLYTYILGRRLEEMGDPTPELMGADVSTDFSKYPSLILDDSPPEAYKTAVSEVLGKLVAYNNEPIQTAYCISSGGVTESAKTVLGVDLPYLQSVVCDSFDSYVTELVYTSSEVFARLTTSCEGITLYGEPLQWFSISEQLDSGYVVKIAVCEELSLSGREFAHALNLPSANFSFNYSQAFDRFSFKVNGCGHLVGLSLNGACAMAENGKTCEEIINYFFTGVKIKDSVFP